MKRMLIALVLLLSGICVADDWPDVPAPKGVEKEWVADRMVFNGVAMRIFTYNYDSGVDGLRDFYIDAWERNGQEYKQSRQGKWLILSSLQGDYYTTVQITDLAGRAYAQVGVSRISDLQSSAPPGEGFPVLPRSQIISDITAQDAGRPSRTVIASNQHSVGSNYNYYLNRYRSKNWTVVRNSLDQARRGASIHLAKEDREMSIVIKREGGSVNIMSVEVRQ